MSSSQYRHVSTFGLPLVIRRCAALQHKGVGTSPKVREPVKVPSHLEQKLTPLGHISTQICALLVLVNRFPYKIALKKEGKYFKKNFGRKVSGMAPVAPPVPTPMLMPITFESNDTSYSGADLYRRAPV